MARQPRIGEHVCHCKAYKYPHRFGGGRCTGIHIAEQTWERCYGSGICSMCNCYNTLDGSTCDVVEGLESVEHCEAFHDYVEFHEIKIDA